MAENAEIPRDDFIFENGTRWDVDSFSKIRNDDHSTLRRYKLKSKTLKVGLSSSKNDCFICFNESPLKPFLYMIRKSRQKFKYLQNEKSF